MPEDNNTRPQQYAPRRQSYAANVGNVVVGGGAPVVVQSMTDTDTADDLATAIQCADLVRAGAEMVRITVNTPKAAAAVESVRKRLDDMDINAPLVGDFHYNGHKLLAQYPACARALAKYRINPGNIGKGDKHDAHFRAIVDIALHNDKPLRIGVNWGSLDPDLLAAMMDENARAKPPQDSQSVLRAALVKSVLLSADAARQWGMPPSRIIVSCKTSRIPDLLAVYRRLAKACRYPLHLGLTEAGGGLGGAASSSAAMAILLAEGIGDTIRASLTPAPGAARSDEAKLCCLLLQSMGLRAFAPRVAACPGCGRTGSDFFRRLAGTIEEHITQQLPKWKRQYPGVENLNIAVMGCIVNGPGESQHADIGISLPGSGENPVAPVFIDGKKSASLKGNNIAADFINILEQYINNKYARTAGGDIVGVVLAGGRGRRMGGGDKGLLMLGGMTLVSVAVRRLRKQTRAVIINANRNHRQYEALGCPVIADAATESGDNKSRNFGAADDNNAKNKSGDFGKNNNDNRNCESQNNKGGDIGENKKRNNDKGGGNNKSKKRGDDKGGGADNFGDDDNKGGGGDDSCRFAGPLAGMLAGMRAADGEWVLFVPCDCPFFPATLARALFSGAKEQNADIAVAVADGREQPVFMLVRRRLADDLAAFVGGGGRKIDLWYRRHQCAKVAFEDGAAFVNINTPEDLAAAQKRFLTA